MAEKEAEYDFWLAALCGAGTKGQIDIAAGRLRQIGEELRSLLNGGSHVVDKGEIEANWRLIRGS